MEDQEQEQEQQLGQWFVVQTLSGQELRVKQSLEKRRLTEGIDDFVFEAVVPMQKVSEVRRGKKTASERKFFPGYLLVRVKLYDEDGEIFDQVWYFVKQTQGVIQFMGGERPVPLTSAEIDGIMEQSKEGEESRKPKVQFEIGESITIKDGAFASFEGAIESVDPDRGKLRVSVSIFGRSTPVELEYWQVERN